MTIPKKIHHIYFSGWETVSDKYKYYVETWKKHHPDWEFHFWEEGKMSSYVEENFPDFFSLYDAYPLVIQKCEVMRYLLMQKEGGYYLDMDIECLKSIDHIAEDFKLVLSKNVGYNQAIIGSIPGHPFWNDVLGYLRESHAETILVKKGEAMKISQTTGPIFFTDALKKSGYAEHRDTKSCQSYIFEPGAPMKVEGKIVSSSITDETVSIHHMSMEWMSWHHRLISGITGKVFKLILQLSSKSSKKQPA